MSSYETPLSLYDLIEENRIVDARAAVEEGVDVNETDSNEDPTYGGSTALQKAAEKGEVKIAIVLVALGADLNLQNNGGFTAMHCACFNGHLEVLRFLIENGADMEIGNGKGWTPLHCAASKGFTELVKLLITNGAEINAVNKYGDTPLHWAIHNKKIPTAKLLIDSGSDTDRLENYHGLTALEKARNGNLLEIVHYIERKRKHDN